MAEYETVWCGAGGHFSLSSVAASISTAARAAAEGDRGPVVVEPVRRRSGRGYRAVGGRLRDLVFTHVPAAPTSCYLRDIAATIESTGDQDLAQIAKALLTLTTEGRVVRVRVRGRWTYRRAI